jgi:protein involved in polysaccharide export with SLBB domain
MDRIARSAQGRLAAGACLLMGLLAAGCLSTGDGTNEPQPAVEEPKIHAGLVLGVNVIVGGKSGEGEVIKEITATGEITLPLVGTIKCDGLTLDELKNKLVTAYSQYIHDPQITVRFLYGENMLSPWGTVLVMGQVGRPGPVNIPPTRDLTVTRALQLAGGTTALGDQSDVRITRKLADGKTRKIKLDLKKIGEKGLTEQDIVLRSGDVIYVPEIFW